MQTLSEWQWVVVAHLAARVHGGTHGGACQHQHQRGGGIQHNIRELISAANTREGAAFIPGMSLKHPRVTRRALFVIRRDLGDLLETRKRHAHNVDSLDGVNRWPRTLQQGQRRGIRRVVIQHYDVDSVCVSGCRRGQRGPEGGGDVRHLEWCSFRGNENV